MVDQRLGQFYEGIASWRRMLLRSTPEAQVFVFNNAMAEIAGYVAKGMAKAAAVDELADMADSIGLAGGDPDQIQALIAEHFTRVVNVAKNSPLNSPSWTDEYSGDYSSAVTLDRLDDQQAEQPFPKKQSKPQPRGNGHDPEPLSPPYANEGFMAELRPPQWLIEGVLQRRFLYALTGKTSSGKTAIALYIAACVALGRPLGELDVVQGAVLYLAGENPDDVRYRWVAMSQHMEFDDSIPVHWWERGTLSQAFGMLEDYTRSIGGVALVIVDTSAAYFEGDEVNSNTQQGDHARMLRRLVDLPGGPAVIALAHPVKRAAADDLIPLGAGAFLNELDGNLTVAKEGPATELHWQAKIRGPDFDPIHFELTEVTHERLKDTAGRQFKTVIARHISDASREAMDAAAKGDADLVLLEMERDPKGSLRDYALRLGWTLASGKPYYSRVRRAVTKLQKAKLLTVELGDLALTKTGSKRAKKKVDHDGSKRVPSSPDPSFLDQ